jgi:uncharacterized RDD family membrane protein YckC
MQCQQCGWENHPGARACESCAAALAAPTEYAPLLRRAAAGLIDLVAAVVVIVAGIFVAALIGGFIAGIVGTSNSTDDKWIGAIMIVAAIVMPWLYWAVLESRSFGATLGKLALGIKVTKVDGSRAGFWRSSARFWARILALLIPFHLGFLMMSFTERKQALYDLIAKTIVVRKATTAAIPYATAVAAYDARAAEQPLGRDTATATDWAPSGELVER